MGSIDIITKQDTVTNATKKRREEDDDADEENNDLRRDALEEAANTDDDHMTSVRCWVLVLFEVTLSCVSFTNSDDVVTNH